VSAKVETAGKFPRCVGTHTVVLYDPHDGRVHHLHHALVFEGQQAPPTPAALEAVARRNAARRPGGAPPMPLEALHLKDVALSRGPHRVDVAHQVLFHGPAAS
jgi:hypothetical protein